MVPFLMNEDTDDQGEGSSQSKRSRETTPSDKLSALPPHTTPPRVQRISPPPSTERAHRRSFDGSLLNFPSFLSESELSPLRRLKDKFGTHTSRGTAPRISASEGNSPNYGRFTIDNDHSQPAWRTGRRGFGQHSRAGSDSHLSPPLRSATYATNGDTSPSNQHHDFGSRSPSNSQSRGVSPFRFIQTISAGLHQSRGQHHEPEEPFVPINPFKSKISFDFTKWFRLKPVKAEPDIELAEASVSSNNTGRAGNCNDILMISSIRDCAKHANIFILDILPRLLYLNLLLRLPALYFSRVARIFRDAEVSRPDIERMIEAGEYCVLPPAFDVRYDDQEAHAIRPSQYRQAQDVTGDRRGERSGKARGVPVGHSAVADVGLGVAATGSGQAVLPAEACPPPVITPTLRRFKHSWEVFVDSLLKEWKTLNVVSALLASAILTVFQIPDAAGDPITRTTAILSLICALMSLTYGCMYIVRFSTMRSMVRASKWAEEARRTNTAILWNVWVLLAMPAIWLAWSMLIFMVCILSFVWRTGSESDPSERPPLSKTAILGPRIVTTFMVFIGVVYLLLIIRTLKSYGIHGGRSENMLTSPQTRLGVLGDVHHHHGTRVPGEAGGERGALGVGHDHGDPMEVALERRGRERTRSIGVRHGRRREERTEVREHRSISIQDGFREGNGLGLKFPIISASSSGKAA